MNKSRKIALYAGGAVVLILVIVFWPFGLTKFKTSGELQQQELFAFVPVGYAAGTVTGTEFSCDGATSNPATAVRTFKAAGNANEFVDAFVKRAPELNWKGSFTGYAAGVYTTRLEREEGKHNLNFVVDADQASPTWKVTISEQPDDHTC